MNPEPPLPEPEVEFLDGEFGHICWDQACAAMDDTSEFALSYVGTSSDALACSSVRSGTYVSRDADRA